MGPCSVPQVMDRTLSGVEARQQALANQRGDGQAPSSALPHRTCSGTLRPEARARSQASSTSRAPIVAKMVYPNRKGRGPHRATALRLAGTPVSTPLMPRAARRCAAVPSL
jgi:hypothetical protein